MRERERERICVPSGHSLHYTANPKWVQCFLVVTSINGNSSVSRPHNGGSSIRGLAESCRAKHKEKEQYHVRVFSARRYSLALKQRCSASWCSSFWRSYCYLPPFRPCKFHGLEKPCCLCRMWSPTNYANNYGEKKVNTCPIASISPEKGSSNKTQE